MIMRKKYYYVRKYVRTKKGGPKKGQGRRLPDNYKYLYFCKKKNNNNNNNNTNI